MKIVGPQLSGRDEIQEINSKEMSVVRASAEVAYALLAVYPFTIQLWKRNEKVVKARAFDC